MQSELPVGCAKGMAKNVPFTQVGSLAENALKNGLFDRGA
jgi:hypothetical protein